MPLYLFKCVCGEMVEQRHSVASIPEVTSCHCGRRAARIFCPSVNILTCPLSIEDQGQRAQIEHGNQLSPEQIKKWERSQQEYADRPKEPERPTFDQCLADARRELASGRL